MRVVIAGDSLPRQRLVRAGFRKTGVELGKSEGRKAA